jgi:ADP-heptose:LPS heptosyltransferase
MQNKIVARSTTWQKGVNAAVKLLRSKPKALKILIEQNRNLGDTLHLIPIIKHYRLLHPNAMIVFLTAHPYANAWAYNEDVNYVVTIPSLNPQHRIALRRRLLEYNNTIKIIAPSIFPYGEVWKNLKWSFPNIADQYLYNAGIKDLKPKGGRRLKVTVDDQDRRWAKNFADKHKLTRKNSIGCEYISYSHQPTWQIKHFKKLITLAQGFKFVSMAGAKEPLIPGTVDARGISWRKTVALMNHLGVFCGIGSGLTMIASAASNQPRIIELAVSDSITMKSCGYANSIRFQGISAKDVAALIKRIIKEKP